MAIGLGMEMGMGMEMEMEMPLAAQAASTRMRAICGHACSARMDARMDGRMDGPFLYTLQRLTATQTHCCLPRACKRYLAAGLLKQCAVAHARCSARLCCHSLCSDHAADVISPLLWLRAASAQAMGLSIGRGAELIGWRGVPLAPLAFTRLQARVELLLGKEGSGLDTATVACEQARSQPTFFRPVPPTPHPHTHTSTYVHINTRMRHLGLPACR